MLEKKDRRKRRSLQTRVRIRTQQVSRLSVHRTNLHIYANIFSGDGKTIIASASTVQAAVKSELTGNGGNVAAASVVGRIIAIKATAAGIKNVAFDRSGFAYHGRVKALADAAREHGLVF